MPRYCNVADNIDWTELKKLFLKLVSCLLCFLDRRDVHDMHMQILQQEMHFKDQ